MTLIYALQDYKKRDGSYSIRLRITIDRKHSYIASGIAVNKNQWNERKKLVKGHILEDKLNAKLNALKNEFQSFALNFKDISSKELVRLWKSQKKTGKLSFTDFYRSINIQTRKQGKISSSNTSDQYLVKLEKFKPGLSFLEITPDFLVKFENFMYERGNAVNTVASNMKYLKTVVKKAIKAGYMEKNPFDSYQIKTENSEKQSFNYGDILRLESIKIAPNHKGFIRARDMFLFAFYNAGMRFGDVCRLKWENIKGNEIVYVMHKSKKRSGSKRRLPITSKVRVILDKYKGKNKDYIFHFLSGVKENDLETIEDKIKIANNAVNRSFKLLCKKNKLKPITFHASKHSFADYAVKSGIDLLTISKLLGHTKLSTTQVYLKDFYQDQQSKAITQMFE